MSRHQSRRTKTTEYLTPKYIIDALGPFDLDPCAARKRPWPTAREHYTVDMDGLSMDWKGRVWLNPPYGDHMYQWMQKMALHNNGIALIFARTETKLFFEQVWPRCSAVLFLRGRVKFYDTEGNIHRWNGGAPSVLIAYGSDNAQILESSGIDGKFLWLRENFADKYRDGIDSFISKDELREALKDTERHTRHFEKKTVEKIVRSFRKHFDL